MVRALAARSLADRELLEPDWEAGLEDFGVGQAAVGHVRLDRVGPVMAGARARAAGDGLIILIVAAAEREVVHRPLRRRQPAGRREQGVGDNLAGLDVTRNHGCRVSGVEHGPIRHDQPNRPQAPVVHGDRVVDQGPHDIERGRSDDRSRRIEIVGQLAAGPGEIERRRPRRLVDADRDADGRSIVHRIIERAVVQSVDQPPHRFLGVGEDVAHVGGDDVGADVARRFDQSLGAANAGGKLRAQVRQIAIDIARRIRARCQQGADFRLAETALVDQQCIVDQDAFILDRAAVGRHRSRRDPADIGMVSARRDKGRGRLVAVIVEHRDDHRDVGQMGSAAIGVVEDICVAAPDAAPVRRLASRLDDRPDALAHRSQMHRDMRGVGDQRARRVEQGAGKIEPLLDIDRSCGRLQRDAHFLGDRHEQIAENLEHHRVGVGADRLAMLGGRGAGQD